ncbi:MAG: hypothetical protein AB4426_29605 [Xenococcaceae cyanobacterium]
MLRKIALPIILLISNTPVDVTSPKDVNFNPNQQLVSANAQESKLSITNPEDGARVGDTLLIEGVVDTTLNADLVWIIVHPMNPGSSGQYWVQVPVTIRPDGTWKTRVYIGNRGENYGETFEIGAIVKPEVQLSKGVRENWPKAEFRSQIIEVTKRKPFNFLNGCARTQ